MDAREHLKGFLDNTDTFELLLSACNSLSQAKIPRDIGEALMGARFTALNKPDGGVRAVATGCSLRMKEAKERASGAVKRDWEPRLIEARYLGQHARTGAMIGSTTDGIVCGRLGRRLPEAERWDQTGWQDLKGVPWDWRPTGLLEPEVDVEAQPGAAEAERRVRVAAATRETRTSQAQRRNAPRRSAREMSQIRRAICNACIAA